MMMPVAEGFQEHQIDYKQKYKTLKKKLRLLVYEQECFLEELRKAQRKLLKVTRDRSFLLDRLLQYEKVTDSSGDSDATASSDSDADGHKDGVSSKKRKAGSSGDLGHMISGVGRMSSDGVKKKKSSLKKSKGHKSGGDSGNPGGQMTREELERHLESRQHSFGIEKTPTLLPMEIFSNDNSNPDSMSDIIGAEEEDTDLIIDVPH
ncbi:uncharacterized protein LOC121367362 isoform X1 [Gigantopelta aegis]|uniref:uncharacterized protein LOC121367362 isoform X1 n=1 Tax=Gigantopelta aegis TaxID=1735272 RepID=UPI001B88C2DE|nr:uncharacterized protein LOC121367362 isoform X1 [Gigantopelta aegis]